MRRPKDIPISSRTRYGKSLDSLLERLPVILRGMRCSVDVIPRRHRWETVRRLIARAKRQGVPEDKIGVVSPGNPIWGRNPTYQRYRVDPDDKRRLALSRFIVVEGADYFYDDQYKTWLDMTVPIVLLFDSANRAFSVARQFHIVRTLKWV